MDRRGDGTLEEDEMRGRHVVFGRLFAALVALFALGIFAVSPAAAADGDTLEVDLEALNDFDFNGTAVITEENGAITVEIAVEGVDVVGGHPVHIHLGTCNELDPNPTYPLADIDAEGFSTTPVEGVTLDDLLSGEDDYAINAHVSATDIPTYTTCGNIKAAGEDGEDDAVAADDDAAATADDDAAAVEDDTAAGGGDTTTETTAAVTAAPATGTGGSLGDAAGMSALLTMLGSLAAVLAVAGVTLRVREERARR